MHRRSLLAGVASAGCSSAVLAGCPSAEASQSTTPEVPADPDEPIARATIGSPSIDHSPHRVRLWNRTDERRSVGLEIESETATFDGGYDLDPDDHVVVTIRDRNEYAVVVSVDGATVAETTLEASTFDQACPATELFVLEDGEFESTFEPESDHC